MQQFPGTDVRADALQHMPVTAPNVDLLEFKTG
jgi:hypothetical protein